MANSANSLCVLQPFSQVAMARQRFLLFKRRDLLGNLLGEFIDASLI
ncbi:hypothetical protein SAMN02745132_00522 [Enterovibrio nigricans DSM 22720]|uniref:Uncharacterized protein n=1 Tax=Enterovibrio nigricans DSM 22720 TaxID=1121868 RepID=A0A1T4U178_9GAMM|nr:hypothetical protein SAMN02745132_00522 [Enterovibrio nigricans DSM 22720]